MPVARDGHVDLPPVLFRGHPLHQPLRHQLVDQRRDRGLADTHLRGQRLGRGTVTRIDDLKHAQLRRGQPDRIGQVARIKLGRAQDPPERDKGFVHAGVGIPGHEKNLGTAPLTPQSLIASHPFALRSTGRCKKISRTINTCPKNHITSENKQICCYPAIKVDLWLTSHYLAFRSNKDAKTHARDQ